MTSCKNRMFAVAMCVGAMVAIAAARPAVAASGKRAAQPAGGSQGRVVQAQHVEPLAGPRPTSSIATPKLGQLHFGPGVAGFGYYPTTWREWPCEARQDKIFPESIGREWLRTPPPGKPAETIPAPRGRTTPGGAEFIPPLPEPRGPIAPPEGLPSTPEQPFPIRPGLPGLEIPAEPSVPEPPTPGGILPGPATPGGMIPSPPTPGGILPGATPPQRPMTPGLPNDLEGLPLDPQGQRGPAAPSSGGVASGPSAFERAVTSGRRPEPIQPYEPSPEQTPRGPMRSVWRAPERTEVVADSSPALASPPPRRSPQEPAASDAGRPSATVSPVTTASAVPAVGDQRVGLEPPVYYQPVGASSPPAGRQTSHTEPPTRGEGFSGQSSVPGEASLALGGFCPVELIKNERWVPGDPACTVVYQGKTYAFSSPIQRECFLVDPDRYAPAFGGADPVVLEEQGREAPGRAEFCVTYDGRLYMFTDAASLARFRQSPERYTVGPSN